MTSPYTWLRDFEATIKAEPEVYEQRFWVKAYIVRVVHSLKGLLTYTGCRNCYKGSGSSGRHINFSHDNSLGTPSPSGMRLCCNDFSPSFLWRFQVGLMDRSNRMDDPSYVPVFTVWHAADMLLDMKPDECGNLGSDEHKLIANQKLLHPNVEWEMEVGLSRKTLERTVFKVRRSVDGLVSGPNLVKNDIHILRAKLDMPSMGRDQFPSKNAIMSNSEVLESCMSEVRGLGTSVNDLGDHVEGSYRQVKSEVDSVREQVVKTQEKLEKLAAASKIWR